MVGCTAHVICRILNVLFCLLRGRASPFSSTVVCMILASVNSSLFEQPSNRLPDVLAILVASRCPRDAPSRLNPVCRFTRVGTLRSAETRKEEHPSASHQQLSTGKYTVIRACFAFKFQEDVHSSLRSPSFTLFVSKAMSKSLHYEKQDAVEPWPRRKKAQAA